MPKVNPMSLESRQNNQYKFMKFKKFLSSLKEIRTIPLSGCLDNPYINFEQRLTEGGGNL